MASAQGRSAVAFPARRLGAALAAARVAAAAARVAAAAARAAVRAPRWRAGSTCRERERERERGRD